MEQISALLEALAGAPAAPTKVTEPAAALDRHVADSLSGLAVHALANARVVADVGSGAGFPGLPLAIALPEAHLDLIEATRRKCEVIERLAAAAGLGNARAVPERAETWAGGAGEQAYAAVTARAVAPLAVLVEYAAPLLEVGGTFVAWKGARDPEEETHGAEAARLLGLRPAGVVAARPFAGVRTRHLHVFVKEDHTPAGFPRRPGMASKRPLGG